MADAISDHLSPPPYRQDENQRRSSSSPFQIQRQVRTSKNASNDKNGSDGAMAPQDAAEASRPASQRPEIDHKRSSSLARIQRQFRTLRTHISESSVVRVESDDQIHGPLGLNLLSDPSEPHTDFIFVHGLGGGSRKTWSAGSDPALFWPKIWLPSEPGFKHVRIHSYGYNSDWGQMRQSLLTVHDFGQALLADIHNSPHFKKNGDTPIVMVAHSLGGLVVKKAYLLATRDPLYSNIAKRMHSLYFLGTPHRGASSAQLLSKLIFYKAFVNELFPGSGTLQTINDEFRHVCSDLHLWSFFEGLPTASLALLVERDSAVMGLPGEHVQYLNADHRRISKFESCEDPNYLILQRCFTSTIEDIERDYILRRREGLKSEMRLIGKFLDVQQTPEADLLSTLEKQYPGTCTWLTDSPTFHAWSDDCLNEGDVLNPHERPRFQGPRFLWLNGPPGSGKSVACGHAVQHLNECNLDCSFYFLKHGNPESSTVAMVLRSIAYQMAESHFEIRKALLSMIASEDRINTDDYTMVWNNIFMGRIFKIGFTTAQFWVIDALDECFNRGTAPLLQMLSRIPTSLPIQVLLSSRPSFGGSIRSALNQEGRYILEVQTGDQNSLGDIARFIKSKRSHSVVEQGISEELLQGILTKANGIFLWVSLVMTRLEETYSEEDMQAVLQEVPMEMNDFYDRIAKKVARTPNFELAKCILKWAIYASRPLTTNEMREAIRLDANRTLTAADDRLGHLCGDLILVDSHSRVQAIHQTVRSFLIEHQSEFHIDRPTAHSRLAEVCLIYLTSKDFAPPRSRRGPTTASKHNPLSSLAEYACTNFSYHLVHSSSAVDAPLVLLDQFLRSNGLAWIERISQEGSLRTLVQTVRNIRTYLARRAKYRSPLGKELQLAGAWANDLAHIVTAFGSNLLESPSCIYSLIPILSPPASNIHQLFVKEFRQLRLLGREKEDWNDRISCFIYPSPATSLAICENYLAVGLSKGGVTVYDTLTLQCRGTILHGEAVRLLAYGPSSSFLAICGPRTISLWNSQRTCIWTKVAKHYCTPISVCFNTEEDQLVLALRDGTVSFLSVGDGSQVDSMSLYHSSESESDEEDQRIRSGTPPALVKMSLQHGLMAVAYRNSHASIWDMDKRKKIGEFMRPGTEDGYIQPQILDMAFKSKHEDLMAIAYEEVGIVTCDPWSLEQHEHYEIDARIMATSTDGQILAAGNYYGVIHIFAFEYTLRLMYRISALEEFIRGIVFAPNNLRFYDVRGKLCNIWEPSVLVRRDSDDDASSEPLSDEIVLPAPDMVFAAPLNDEEYITCLAHSADGRTMFCGRTNGTISVIDLLSGKTLQDFDFFEMKHPIKHIAWNADHNLLVCVNELQGFVITRLTGKLGLWQVAERLIDVYLDNPVMQLIIKSTGDSILVATPAMDATLNIKGDVLSRLAVVAKERSWLPHPNDPESLLLLCNNNVRIYNWTTLQVVANLDISTHLSDDAFLSLSGSWISRKGSDFLIKAGPLNADRLTGFITVDVPKLSMEAAEVPTICCSKKLAADVKHVLGLHKSTLVFLDTKGWICSIAKGVKDAKHYSRHFFIPHIWLISSDILLQIVAKGTIALALRDRLIVFQGFMDFEEKIAF